MNLADLILKLALDGDLVLELNGQVAVVPAAEAAPVVDRVRRLLDPEDTHQPPTLDPRVRVAEPGSRLQVLKPNSREADVLRAAADMPNEPPWTVNELTSCGGFDRDVSSAVSTLTKKRYVVKVDGHGGPTSPFRHQITRAGRAAVSKLPPIKKVDSSANAIGVHATNASTLPA